MNIQTMCQYNCLLSTLRTHKLLLPFVCTLFWIFAKFIIINCLLINCLFSHKSAVHSDNDMTNCVCNMEPCHVGDTFYTGRRLL